MNALIRTALLVVLIAALANAAACGRRSRVMPSSPPAVVPPALDPVVEKSVEDWRRRADEAGRLERQPGLSDSERTRLRELRRELQRDASPLYRALLELDDRLLTDMANIEAALQQQAVPRSEERAALLARRQQIARAMTFTDEAIGALRPYLATAAPLPSPPPPPAPQSPSPPAVPVPPTKGPSPPTQGPPAPVPSLPAPDAPSAGGSGDTHDPARVAKYLDQIRPGHVVFDPPKRMVEGESATVHLLVSADTTIQDLKAELLRLAETGAERQYIAENVSVTRVMRAKLASVDFEIDDSEFREQLTDATATTQWSWQVRPKRVGRLTLTVTLVAMIDDAGTLRPVSKPFERIVTVESRPDTWSDFFERYGPPKEAVYGGIGFVVTAALAWWHKRRRTGRSSGRRRTSTSLE